MMNTFFSNTFISNKKAAVQTSLIAAAVVLSLNTSLRAQTSRTDAMGGLSYSVADEDNSLTPFDFAGNPAWLNPDKQETYLNINPSISNSWGNFRRKYDSEGTYETAAAFEGVKTLDSLGTFLGRTVYTYENRRNYNRILKKDAYTGEGFFYTDSTAGDFRYKGPTVQLMYGWELLPRLYAGGSAKYGLLEGLKNTYTYAKTTYREADVTAGLAYRFSDQFIAGTVIEYFDSQESISSEDVNSYLVLVYNFRGETFSVPLQAISITEKAKKEKLRYGAHFYYEPVPALQFAARASYASSISKMIMPVSGILAEEGRASFENIEVQAQTRLAISENFSAALNFVYLDDQSWSKNSWSNLLLWDWHTRQISLGAGASYRAGDLLLVAVECELSRSALDSSKYIDSRYTSLTSYDIFIKAGAEYKISPGFIIRGGYNRGFFEEGRELGGKDVVYNSFTAGFGISIFADLLINAHIKFTEYSPDNTSGKKRSLLGGYVTLRLNSF